MKRVILYGCGFEQWLVFSVGHFAIAMVEDEVDKHC